MPNEEYVKVEVELPKWLIKSAASVGCNTRRTLEDELGRETFSRLLKETKK